MLYIPELYKDELLYSFISRVISSNSISNRDSIKRLLFCDNNYVINVHVQTNLNNLYSSMPKYFTRRYKIDNLVSKTH